jgi:hypothetical protein
MQPDARASFSRDKKKRHPQVCRGIGRLLHRFRQRRAEAGPCVFRGEARTDRSLTWALVRRRFGIAGVITINLLLPHLHEGAGS